MSATLHCDAGLGVITLKHPPVNGLGHATRSALLAALQQAEADSAVEAIVLTGGPQLFCGGADVREFGTPLATSAPLLPDLIERIEACGKPVIAAIAGVCLGGGLELALGCHYRIARADARLGLPEVQLGLIPGAGGTQRLPRLLGLEAALQFMLAAKPSTAAALRHGALLDLVVDTADDALWWQTVAEAAGHICRSGVAQRGALPWVSLRPVPPVPAGHDWQASTRARIEADNALGLPAAQRCAEAVALAAELPCAAGRQRERALFLELLASPSSGALRHIFAAERACTKVAGLPAGTTARPLQRVGVVGAGTMGSGITISLLDAGLTVQLVESRADGLERGQAAIREHYASAQQKGRLRPAEVEERLGRLGSALQLASLAEADLIIEAVTEDWHVKSGLLTELDRIARPGAILASNTSCLDLDRLAAGTRRPQDVIGLHFFSPAQVMKLLEVVRGAATAPEVLATALALGRRLGKISVVAGVCDGFIGNRMLARYVAAAFELVHAGASPEQVDTALQDYGLAMGPLRMGDLAGLDIGRATRHRRAAEAGRAPAPCVADRLCDAGRLGQKSGAGWYRYASGSRQALPDPAVAALIEAFRAEQGIVPRHISAAEIVERCLAALVNEGARVLQDGIAARASDIDLVFLHGYGHPRRRGGPMHAAAQQGLAGLVETLQRCAAEPGADPSWQPAELLLQCAASGRWPN